MCSLFPEHKPFTSPPFAKRNYSLIAAYAQLPLKQRSGVISYGACSSWAAQLSFDFAHVFLYIFISICASRSAQLARPDLNKQGSLILSFLSKIAASSDQCLTGSFLKSSRVRYGSSSQPVMVLYTYINIYMYFFLTHLTPLCFKSFDWRMLAFATLQNLAKSYQLNKDCCKTWPFLESHTCQ